MHNGNLTWLIVQVTCEHILDKHVCTELDTLDVGIATIKVHRQNILEIHAKDRPSSCKWCRATMICNKLQY